MISAVSGRRVYYRHGGKDGYEQMQIFTDLYACLVGPQGSRKSFAKDVVRDLLSEVMPDIPLSASVETAEGLDKFLGSEESARCFQNEDGVTETYHPIFLLINELVNFLAVNPAGMINNLVDIYNNKFHRRRTKNKGDDVIVNPCLNILACATTEYVVDQLRSRILSGGLARRMLFINEREEYVRNPDPRPPTGGQEAWARVKNLLMHIPDIVGPYKWESERAFNNYCRWYKELKMPSDPLLAGFYRSKHIQIWKLMIINDLASAKPMRLLTQDNFDAALAAVDAIEPGMESLFLCSGRNVLAMPEQSMLDVLKREGGLMSEKALLRCNKDLNPTEMMSVLLHLRESGQVFKLRIRRGETDIMVYANEERYREGLAKGEWK